MREQEPTKPNKKHTKLDKNVYGLHVQRPQTF